MKLYEKNYIVPGDIFADQTVLCLRCCVPIMVTGYREMPKINEPKQKVNVACKLPQMNYSLLPVVIKSGAQLGIMQLPVCKDCFKKMNPAKESASIIGQIIDGIKTEANWIGSPAAVLDGIEDRFAGVEIVRRLTEQEMREQKILEVA